MKGTSTPKSHFWDGGHSSNLLKRTHTFKESRQNHTVYLFSPQSKDVICCYSALLYLSLALFSELSKMRKTDVIITVFYPRFLRLQNIKNEHKLKTGLFSDVDFHAFSQVFCFRF